MKISVFYFLFVIVVSFKIFLFIEKMKITKISDMIIAVKGDLSINENNAPVRADAARPINETILCIEIMP